jgi:hypothetical protein
MERRKTEARVGRWATHGPTGDIVGEYTTLPWQTICEEVVKARISLLEGKLIELPMVVTMGNHHSTAACQGNDHVQIVTEHCNESPVTPLVTWRKVPVTNGVECVRASRAVRPDAKLRNAR